MTKGYTLDTNILSALIREEKGVTEKAEQTQGVNVTAIAAGELLFGAYKKKASPALLKKVQNLLRRLPVYNLTLWSPDIWGEQKAILQSRGITIPDNDLWIAAIALEHNLTVVTRDAHFNHIEGLTVERW